MSNNFSYKIDYAKAIAQDEVDIALLQSILELGAWAETTMVTPYLLCSSPARYGLTHAEVVARMGVSEAFLNGMADKAYGDGYLSERTLPFPGVEPMPYGATVQEVKRLCTVYGRWWSTKEKTEYQLKKFKSRLAAHKRNQKKNN